MVNLLFIHDYGAAGNSHVALMMKALVKDYARLVAPDFPQNPITSINKAKVIIDLYKIDMIIGYSYGGFIALNNSEQLPKVLINPMLEPSKELTKRFPESAKYVKDLTELETKLTNKNPSKEEKAVTYGLFCTYDEEFSYKEVFSKQYTNIEALSTGHKITPAIIEKSIVPLIYQLIRILQLHR